LRGLIRFRGFVNEGGHPCCVDVYRIREYAAVMKTVMEIGMSRIKDLFKVLEINIISLSRLILGGAAIFAADRMNQRRVIKGNRFRSPLVIYILRVWVVS